MERSFFGDDARVDALMEDAIQAMAKAGATIVDNTLLAARRDVGAPSYQVLLYEFKADLAAYLEMPFFGQQIFELAEAKGDLTTPEYLESLETALRLARSEGIDTGSPTRASRPRCTGGRPSCRSASTCRTRCRGA